MRKSHLECSCDSIFEKVTYVAKQNSTVQSQKCQFSVLHGNSLHTLGNSLGNINNLETASFSSS